MVNLLAVAEGQSCLEPLRKTDETSTHPEVETSYLKEAGLY